MAPDKWPTITSPWSPLPPSLDGLQRCQASYADAAIAALISTGFAPDTMFPRATFDAVAAQVAHEIHEPTDIDGDALDPPPAHMFPTMAVLVLDRLCQRMAAEMDLMLGTQAHTTTGQS